MPKATKGEPLAFVRGILDHEGEECVTWPYALTRQGYSQINYNLDGKKQPMTASRLIVILKNGGTFPDGKNEAAHTCGNRSCVNPKHIYPATWIENSLDKIEHGRENNGTRNGMSRLSDKDIIDIHNLYAKGGITQKEIGKLYNVRDSAICRILTGKRWPHLHPKNTEQVK